MNGRRARLGLGMALTLVLACGEEAKPPNLLLIAVDTLRADHLGAYGYSKRTSPEIDALLASSVVFEDVQSSSAWTLPSFATLMTSLHPGTHGCRSFETGLAASHTTLAEILRDAGYETGAVVSHSFMDARYGLDQGFGSYDQSLVQDMQSSHRAVTSPQVQERAEAWLAARSGDRPWFLWVHYFDPHHDYQVHPGISDAFPDDRVGRYDGEIAFTDAHVGQLLASLDAHGQQGETVVVFVTDHGEEFGEHGRIGHGRSLHREVTRLGLGIRAPGVAPRRVETPVHAVDLLPTLLELAGVPAPSLPLAGRSLVSLFEGSAGATWEPRALVAELSLHPDSVKASYRLGRWKLFEHYRPPDPPLRSLFDVERDPEERHDLASANPQRVAEYSQELARELQAARALGRDLGMPVPVEIQQSEIDQLRALGYVD